MPKESINQLRVIKIVAIGLILTTVWFVLGNFYPDIFFFTWLPLLILAAFFIHEKLPDMYLIPVIFSLTVFYNLADNIIIKRMLSVWETFFLIVDFVCAIFIFFFLFSYRIFNRSNPTQKYEEEKEIIVKKLLWLILAAIVAVIIFFSLQIILYNYEN